MSSSSALALVLALPLLGWVGIGDPWLYFWHPVQGPLDLMGARVAPLGAGRAIYALVWPVLWLVPAYAWSRTALRRSTVT